MKTALITGAYRGLGLETAEGLAAKGFHVVITARKTKEGAEAVKRISARGQKATFIPMDVTDAQSIRSAVDAFSKEFSCLDVLINNAALFIDQNVLLTETSMEVLTQTLEANTFGAVRVIQNFAPHLKKSKQGRIINVSSGLGSLSEMQSYAPAYSISKAALNAVTRQFAMIFQKDGIAVNSVCPGWCRTEMGGAHADRSAEEGASGIIWLAADAPQSLTGKFLRDRKEIKW